MTEPSSGPRLAALDADDLRRYREHGCPGDLGPWLHWLSERKREEAAIRRLPAELGLTANWTRVFELLMQRLDRLEILPGLQPGICGDAVSVLPAILASVWDHAPPGIERERLLMDLLTVAEWWTYRITCRRTGARFDLRTGSFRDFLARHPAVDLEVGITPDDPLVTETQTFTWLTRELSRGGKG